MTIFNRKPEQQHTISKTWRKGHETDDYVQKLWSASCSCGWTSPEGDFLHVARTVGAHEVAVEAAAFTPIGVS